jgi:hypothetical protein
MRRLLVLSLLVLLVVVPLIPAAYVEHTDSTIKAEPPTGINTRVYGKDYSEEVFGEVSLALYTSIIQKFTENGSRYIMDYSMADQGANMYARRYIIQQFELLSKGKIETEVIGNLYNVVGKLPGYLPGVNPAFAITAHYDSAYESPGANCDGSGIAVVLELVRVMSMFEWPLDIYFIAFNGLLTVSGMEGSPQVVNEFRNNGIDLFMLYNVDTLLVADIGAPLDEKIQFGYASGDYHFGRYWADLARQMSNNIGSNQIAQVPSNSFYLWESSDHYPFYRSGFPVMCAFESGLGYDDQYQGRFDRWNNNQYRYLLGRETASAIGASIAYTMSRGYGEYIVVESDFELRSEEWEQVYITVTTPTIVNVSARWFGGASSFYLLNPSGTLIAAHECNFTSAWEPSSVLSTPVTEDGLYTLIVNNNHSEVVGYEVTITHDADIDDNGVLDSQEYWIDPALLESDQDADGLSDAWELFLGTNPLAIDSDNDAMPDKYEVDNGFDPRNPSDGGEDADSDELSNAQEYTGGLNPFSADSDNDLIPDLWELENGLNPLVNDADLDFDEDGISNLEEYLNDTDPQVPEPLEIKTEMVITPVLLIAVIGAFVYIRRRGEPWN